MGDVSVVAIDEMDGIDEGLMRRARAELGVTAWGMQVLTLPPNWDGYPLHNHAADAYDPNQEEVYVPLEAARRSWWTGRSSSCAGRHGAARA